MSLAGVIGGRRWFAPEVVQTSAMDCGPAALKCILEGFGIPISYGRLREACQTGVDGTSIDTIETVANQLGVSAEQVMLPPDQLFLRSGVKLPALVVVRHAAGPTHFVVVWQQVGQWLQVMDPATGRRWVNGERFLEELFRHELSVPAADWKAWAASEEFSAPLLERLSALGIGRKTGITLIERARRSEEWFPAAVLDAAVRLASSVHDAEAIAPGDEVANFITTLFDATCRNTDDIYTLIPRDYWSVAPDPRSRELGERRVLLRGAVLVRVAAKAKRLSGITSQHDELMPELAAALRERMPHPLSTLWRLLKSDGLLAPLALLGALGIAMLALTMEALLFRGLLDIGAMLTLGSQRLMAVIALLSFMGLMLAYRLPIVSESMRLGRQFDVRLRMALLQKLPRLTDRYFHSRPISDMAERSHSLHLSRIVPGLGIHFIQATGELILTLAGVMLLDSFSGLLAAGLAGLAIAVPLIFQPAINEADLRVRSHSAALHGVYLDSLLGHVPIRVHHAQAAVRRMHEGLLADWSRAMHKLLSTSVLAAMLQQVLCLGFASGLLIEHFSRSTGVTGADLLLVYWTLKLPAAGHMLAGLAQQYPAQRNVLMRLLEPLAAPEQQNTTDGQRQNRSTGVRPSRRAAQISIEDGSVIASGHTILSGLNLSIAAGEHVAIVGPSGAGKSSFMGLLLGWHHLASGRLLVDGHDLDGSHLDSLRRQTAWVDPAIQLWNRSFLDNLTYSTAVASLKHVAAAVDAADLRHVLHKLPSGLQSALGEGGAMLSGGEGQRIRLGRAFMQTGVRLALLDEPFRGMDRQQRARLMDEARYHWRDATLICITHDVGETRNFDRVIVVENGSVAEDGAPDQLMASDTRYRALLAAEHVARDKLWQGNHWDHLRIENGHVIRLS